MYTEISVKTLPIRLGQFLKLANLVQDGIEAKIIISEGMIRVNNEIEKRRGHQLQDGDIIQFDSKSYKVSKK